MRTPGVWLLSETGIIEADGSPVTDLPSAGRKVTAADVSDGIGAVVIDDYEIWSNRDPLTGERLSSWRRNATSDRRVNCLLFAADRTLLAGTADARLGKVHNTEIEYLPAFDAIPERSLWNTPWGGPPDVRSLALSPDGTLYANIHVGWIARSEDNGSSWMCITDGLEKDVHQVAAHPDNPNIVFASTAQGFYISTSKGDVFERKTGEMPYYYQRACGVFPGTDIYLCSTSRGPHGQADALLFRSKNGGENWQVVDALPSGVGANIDTYQIKIVDGRSAYLIVDNTSVWRTEDWGLRWSLLAEDLPRIFGIMTGISS